MIKGRRWELRSGSSAMSPDSVPHFYHRHVIVSPRRMLSETMMEAARESGAGPSDNIFPRATGGGPSRDVWVRQNKTVHRACLMGNSCRKALASLATLPD